MFLISTPNLIMVIILMVFVLIIAIIGVIAAINYNKNERVKKVSPYYLAIVNLNNTTNFMNVNKNYSYYKQSLNSKKQFDNFNYPKRCSEYIKCNLAAFREIVYSIEYNRRIYNEYCNSFKNIRHTSDMALAKAIKMSLDSMIKRETKLALAIKKNVIRDYSITVSASYTSPKGRNSYSSNKTFDYNFIKEVVDSLDHNIKSKASSNTKPKTTNNNKTTNSIDDLEEID